jgi:hypothetical protein
MLQTDTTGLLSGDCNVDIPHEETEVYVLTSQLLAYTACV